MCHLNVSAPFLCDLCVGALCVARSVCVYCVSAQCVCHLSHWAVTFAFATALSFSCAICASPSRLCLPFALPFATVTLAMAHAFATTLSFACAACLPFVPLSILLWLLPLRLRAHLPVQAVLAFPSWSLSFVCCVYHLSSGCVPCVICLSLLLCVSVSVRLEAVEAVFFVLEAVEEVVFVLCFAAASEVASSGGSLLCVVVLCFLSPCH